MARARSRHDVVALVADSALKAPSQLVTVNVGDIAVTIACWREDEK